MAPTSGAPRKYTRFQGRIPCIDARMGLWAQNAYLAKNEGPGKKRSDSWEGMEEGDLVLNIIGSMYFEK